MARSNTGRGIQIGKETTQGVAVAADKLFLSLGLDLNYELTVNTNRAQGFKFDTSSSAQRPLQRGTYEGQLSFPEIVYPLASLCGKPGTGDNTITTPAGGTLSRNWEFLPRAQGQDDIQSYTVEEGDADGATVNPGVVFTGLSINIGDEIGISGGLLGRAGEPGTLTADPAALPQEIASADGVDVYIDDAYTDDAAFFDDANKVTDAFAFTFDFGDKFDPRFVLNTAFTSYKDIVEKPPTISMSFSTEHNAQSRTLFAAALDNPLRFVGFRIKGPIIEGSIRYLFTLVAACNVTPRERTTQGEVWGFTYNCAPIYNSDLGSAFKFNVINKLTAL